MPNIDPTIFKAYDVRGVYPVQINEKVAGAIARGLVKFLQKETGKEKLKLVLGRDVRESGPALMQAFENALLESGTDVINVGQVSTDLFYFSVGQSDVDGGVTISASHNPREFNGFNMARRSAVPIAGESGLKEICALAEEAFENSPVNISPGKKEEKDLTEEFLNFVAGFADLSKINPVKIVADANFGLQAQILEKLVKKFKLMVEIIPLNAAPDGSFPKGHPNPLLPERRRELCELVKSSGANLGVAWDADGDRCFFVDEKGFFLDGCFTTPILAEYLLIKHGGGKVIIDPRVIWASQEAITKAGGQAVICPPGMTIIARRMREEGAIFAGENSSHFYFKENFFRDNGIIPLVIMLGLMTQKQQPLSELHKPYTSKYFISGEVNFKVSDPKAVLQHIENIYISGKIEHIDGLSVSFDQWRFNLRASNTEALLRLNVESKDPAVLKLKTNELTGAIEKFK